MFIFRDKLDVQKIYALRHSQYIQPLLIEDVVAPGAEQVKDYPLTDFGGYIVLGLTGTYTTLEVKDSEAQTLQDFGVCALRFKLQAGASHFELFGNFIPMSHWFSPGRERVSPSDPDLITGGYSLATADIGPVPNQLMFRQDYQYPFDANDVISVVAKNTKDTASKGWYNRYSISFYGVRAKDWKKALAETQAPKK